MRMNIVLDDDLMTVQLRPDYDHKPLREDQSP